jgi:hypothetical protein
MDKKKVAGLGVALVAGLMLGVTVLGGAIAGPKDGAPGAAAAKAASGTAIIMEATAVEDGKLPDLNDPSVHVIPAGSETVKIGSDGTMSPFPTA